MPILRSLPMDGSRQATTANSLIQGFTLALELPHDLPREAYVYELETPKRSLEFAMDLGWRLGFQGEPSVVKAAYPSFPQYEFQEENRYLRLYLYTLANAFVYDDPTLFTTLEPPERLPASKEAAIREAWEYLEDRELLPADCQQEVAASIQMGSWPDPANSQKVRQAPQAWQVVFARELDARGVGGCWQSGATVIVGTDGQVAHITWVHREVAARALYPLRSVDQAWRALQTGGATRVDSLVLGSGAAMPPPFTVRVEKVELGYREAEVTEFQAHFQPFYIFSGTAQQEGKEDSTFPIALYIPALAEAYIQTCPR